MKILVGNPKRSERTKRLKDERIWNQPELGFNFILNSKLKVLNFDCNKKSFTKDSCVEVKIV